MLMIEFDCLMVFLLQLISLSRFYQVAYLLVEISIIIGMFKVNKISYFFLSLILMSF